MCRLTRPERSRRDTPRPDGFRPRMRPAVDPPRPDPHDRLAPAIPGDDDAIAWPQCPDRDRPGRGFDPRAARETRQRDVGAFATITVQDKAIGGEITCQVQR